MGFANVEALAMLGTDFLPWRSLSLVSLLGSDWYPAAMLGVSVGEPFTLVVDFEFLIEAIYF